MLKFSANLTMLFTEVPFLERFAAARRAGFRGVEYVSPYEYYPGDIADRLKANRLSQVLFNLPVGDWNAGERGIAIFEHRRDEFRDGVDRAIRYATALGCPQVNCLAGIAPGNVDASQLRATLVENLRYAAQKLGASGIRLLIEPINTTDMPGFFLNTSQQAMDVIADVGSANLFLQYDAYHMQVMEGDLCPTITRLLPSIKHIQIADHPGRHEPGTGVIDYGEVFGHLERLGYEGWVGAEYKPASTTVAGLGWLAAHGR
jgi:hydroxypyruvate isomerase